MRPDDVLKRRLQSNAADKEAGVKRMARSLDSEITRQVNVVSGGGERVQQSKSRAENRWY